MNAQLERNFVNVVESGVITTLTGLDFELASSYVLTVEATDMGTPSPRSGMSLI